MSNKNSSKSIKWDQFVVDLSLPHDVEELFESFFNSTFCKNDKYGEPLRFAIKYLRYRIPKSDTDFSDKTFIDDARLLFESKSGQKLASFFKRFYSFLYEKGDCNFDLITPKIINLNSVLRYLQNNFTLIKHDPLDTVPEPDKWILIDDNDNFAFDFSSVNGVNLRKYLKEYIWHEITPTMKTKFSRFNYLVDYCNYLTDDVKIELTYGTILRYKEYLKNKYEKNSTAFVVLNGCKDFTKFLELQEYLDTKNMFIDDAFKMVNTNSEAFLKTFNDEEVTTIITTLSDKYRSATDEREKIAYGGVSELLRRKLLEPHRRYTGIGSTDFWNHSINHGLVSVPTKPFFSY